MTEKRTIKMALISGAAHALGYKKKNPKASDEEAIQHVSQESESIIRNMDLRE